jgi:hypothetical protein
MDVKRCDTKLSLKCNPNINEMLRHIDVELIYADANFNPKDLEASVQYYIDNRLR